VDSLLCVRLLLYYFLASGIIIWLKGPVESSQYLHTQYIARLGSTQTKHKRPKESRRRLPLKHSALTLPLLLLLLICSAVLGLCRP